MTEPQRVVGRIIKVSEKGWGFVSSRQIEFTRIFFHWTALRQDTLPFLELRTGMRCEFTPVQVPGKGWRAIQIKVIENEVSALPEPGQENDGNSEHHSSDAEHRENV